MGKILNKNEVRELLYAEYLKNNSKILIPKELEDKKIVSKKVLKRIYGSINADLIWQDIANYFKCHILNTLEQDKIDLIKKLREVAKIEGEPVNSKKHRDLYCKGCKLFGSWRELNMSAGLQVNSIISSTMNINRKDEILEKMMLISCLNKNIQFKTVIQRYNNMPTYETIEKLYSHKWEEIINTLHLDLRDINKYKYINNKEMLINLSKKLKEVKTKSLFNYSFFKRKDDIEFIYIMNKVVINWEWLNVLIRNKIIDCKTEKFKYTKEELLNILSFKYSLLQRHLSSTEINNDPFLPNVMALMKVFNKNIYEVWTEVEKNNKYKL